MSNFLEVCPLRAEVLYAGGHTDRQIYRHDNTNIASRSVASATNNVMKFYLFHINCGCNCLGRTKIKFTAQNLVWVSKDRALSRSVDQCCKLKMRKDRLTESSCTVIKSTFCLNKIYLRANEF